MIAQEIQNVQASMPNLSFNSQLQGHQYEMQQDQYQSNFQPSASNSQDQPDNNQSLVPEQSDERFQAGGTMLTQEETMTLDTMPTQEETMTMREIAQPQASSATMSFTGSAPDEEPDPLYTNQPMKSRRAKSLLNIDWLSPICDYNAALTEQVKQVLPTTYLFICVLIIL